MAGDTFIVALFCGGIDDFKSFEIIAIEATDLFGIPALSLSDGGGKFQHWCGFPAKKACQAAPVLEFYNLAAGNFAMPMSLD